VTDFTFADITQLTAASYSSNYNAILGLSNAPEESLSSFPLMWAEQNDAEAIVNFKLGFNSEESTVSFGLASN